MRLWGKCAVCAEKDARIADLSTEIAFLRNLTTPPPLPDYSVPLIEMESNAILNGQDERIHVYASIDPKQEEIDSEADRILSGNY